MQESLLCKSIWEKEGGSPPHLHYLPMEADPGVVSSVLVEHGCPAFQLSAWGTLVLQALVWHGFDPFSRSGAGPSQQISIPLTSFPWGQAGPYGSVTLLQQMLWTYAVLLSEPVLKAVGGFGDSITTF